jgi:arylsulfatase A-like enzyme
MSRRFLALVCLFVAMAQVAAGRPDVLFIAVDDLNDWTSYLGGHPQAKTPNIDRLVARGTAFTNAHCAAPACNPSRAALMSGLRPWQTGIYLNSHFAGKVMRETTTINRHFLANGYHTLGGGKIYHGYGSEGRTDGWSEWVGLQPGIGNHESDLTQMGRGHFDWGPIPGEASEMGDYKLTSWAIDQLSHPPADKPLFLAVGYVKPHLPWYVPQAYFDRFPLEGIQLPVVKEDDLADMPAAGVKMARGGGDHAAVLKHDQWKKAVQAYLATISFLDDQVGRLLTALETSPRGKETIVVWWTDHGWALGEKEHWRKFALWEETTRTSFAISAPGVSAPGSRSAAPVDYLNVYPTLCELTGLPLPSHVKGASLVPLLKNPSAEWDQVAICTHGKGNHAVRTARYRYIRYENGEEELYDHESDPNEWTNLAAVPERAALKSQLASHLPSTELPAVLDREPGEGGGNGGKAKKKKNKK